ncbi:MAG: hypothetical protein CSA97_05750 [Bacteroidetes bacterium]|nr:MAG: hypothetical protein CSA97_05750 [Bacteroidota bacterium]
MENGTQKKKGSAVVNLLAVVVVVLLLILGALTYFYMKNRMEAESIQRELTADKDSISLNLEGVLAEYDAMQVDNVELQEQIDREREKAEALLSEIKEVKKVSYGRIKEYQRELGTLRQIMRNMVQEIDSLNTINQNLIIENTKVRSDYQVSQATLRELEAEKATLEQAVEKGSRISIRNVSVTALNRRDRETGRAWRAKKLRVCFTLLGNPIARPGTRQVYVRVETPDGTLLASPQGGVAQLDGEAVEFSAARDVDYQNQDLEMCVYAGEGVKFLKGKYQVTLYMDGAEIGSRSYLLK